MIFFFRKLRGNVECEAFASSLYGRVQESLEKTAHVISPADGTDPANELSCLADLESLGKLELGKGPKEKRPCRAQIKEIDQRFFRRRDLSAALSRRCITEKERRLDVVNRNRP